MFSRNENKACKRLVGLIIAAAMILSSTRDVLALRLNAAGNNSITRANMQSGLSGTINLTSADVGKTVAWVLKNNGIKRTSAIVVEIDGQIRKNSTRIKKGDKELLYVLSMAGHSGEKMVYAFDEWRPEDVIDKMLLGGKGKYLAEMTRWGFPVPPGFTISIDAYHEYNKNGEMISAERLDEVIQNLRRLEKKTGKVFGDKDNPLLVSLRSGAPESMPGMMETILNIGLNDDTVLGLAKNSADERFAYDSYRRLIQMFGKTVFKVGSKEFEKILTEVKTEGGFKEDQDITAEALKEKVVPRFKTLVLKEAGREFPQDENEQLKLGAGAVFESWNSPEAKVTRKAEGIPDDLGTAVTVQMMVFGNFGNTSGTGVLFTRNSTTGAKEIDGDFLANAQGEDVVAGIRQTEHISALKDKPGFEEAYSELMGIVGKIETNIRDMADTEFTIERGKLYMLQARVGKRSPQAALHLAVSMVNEGLITEEEAVTRLTTKQLEILTHPQFNPGQKEQAIRENRLFAEGVAASPGDGTGIAVFNPDIAEKLIKEGKPVILIRHETSPADVHGMYGSKAILTATGGTTSHAAIVAKGAGIPATVGTEKSGMRIDEENEIVYGKNGLVIKAGDLISVSGTDGKAFVGKIDTTDSEIVQIAKKVAAGNTKAAEKSELFRDLMTLLGWADKYARLKVKANEEVPSAAALARVYGAKGIGLARTEHMFLGDRLPIFQRIIFAAHQGNTQEMAEILEKELLTVQKEDFIGIFKEMAGFPVTIRLLDPPFNEFLPSLEEISAEITKLRLKQTEFLVAAREGGKGPGIDPEQDEREHQETRRSYEERITEKEAFYEMVKELTPANPMLAIRGVRLGLQHPDIYKMQFRAIFEAAIESKKEGMEVKPQIMIPLVSKARELEIMKGYAKEVAEEVEQRTGKKIGYTLVGTMIELPRAVETATEIAKEAEFFSFGTNDLTQTTFGFSRDDMDPNMPMYIEQEIVDVSPFQTIDTAVLGQVERAAREGKVANPDLEVGLCGEHGGDADSINMLSKKAKSLDYVSASTARVPLARLAAGQAGIEEKEEDKPAAGIEVADLSDAVQVDGAQFNVTGLSPSLARTVTKDTLRLDMELEGGAKGHFVIPEGTSTGGDEMPTRMNKDGFEGVKESLNTIHQAVTDAKLKPFELAEIAQLMIDIGKDALGAEATLSYQMASAWASAQQLGLQPYEFIRLLAPDLASKGVPHTRIQYNITNGGEHAKNDLDMQEFMITTTGKTVAEANAMADNVDRQLGLIYQALGLQADPDDKGVGPLRGKEGGYRIEDLTMKKLATIYEYADEFSKADTLRNLDIKALKADNIGIHEFVINCLLAAIKNAGYTPSTSGEIGTVKLNFDPATTSMLVKGYTNRYNYEGRQISSDELIDIYDEWVRKYPIDSIEDGLGEDDWDGWMALIKRLGDKVLLIGDDLLVTQGGRLSKFIELLRKNGFIGEDGKVNKKLAILIKLNQNGFLTTGIDNPAEGYLGTIEVMRFAKKYGMEHVVSHRSEEAEAQENEVSIAELAAGTNAYALKSGDHVQGIRAVKEDRLAEIDARERVLEFVAESI